MIDSVSEQIDFVLTRVVAKEACLISTPTDDIATWTANRYLYKRHREKPRMAYGVHHGTLFFSRQLQTVRSS